MQQAVHQRLRKYACQPAEEMLRELGVSDRGLEQRQVAQQRRQYGDNRAQREEGGVGRCLQRAVVNPFTVVLLVLVTQLLQELGMKIATKSDRRIRK